MMHNVAFPRSQAQWLAVGLAVFVWGYFSAWFIHPTAGLTLIGIDISEWIKFLPQIGELPNRNIFYLPPMTMSAMLILLTAEWSVLKWQSWVVRLLAVFIAFFSIPSIEAILNEPAGEWRLRLGLFVSVVGLAFVATFLRGVPRWVRLVLGAILALVGAFGPLWAIFIIQPVINEWMGIYGRIGAGVWLNVVGQLVVGLVPAYMAWQANGDR